MEWFIVVGLLLLVISGIYMMRIKSSVRPERFVDYIDPTMNSGFAPDGVMPDVANFTDGEQVLMKDSIKVQTKSGLGSHTAASCATQDRSRQMEVGGQYIQRTNNYRHEYPDSCSSPFTEFVDSIYEPKDGVGLVVPCAGQC
jgi:hypothetical protein